ncbi:DEAD/DEAH box helicase [Bacillus sp. FSL W7-1360]
MPEEKVILHAGWLANDVFIWGEQMTNKRSVQTGFVYPFLFEAFELRLRLYREDPSSFYGTFIHTTRALVETPLHGRLFQSLVGESTVYQADNDWKTYTFPVEGIRLSVDDLAQQYAFLKTRVHDTQFILGDDFTALLVFIDQVLDLIGRGAVCPTNEGAWVLTVDDAWYEQMKQQFPLVSYALRLEQSAGVKPVQFSVEREETVLKRLADAVVRMLIDKPRVKPAFVKWQSSVDEVWQPFVDQLGHGHRGKKGQKKARQSMLSSLGITDAVPFQTALTLVAPKQPEEGWSVSLSVIDVNRPDMIVPLAQVKKGAHPWPVDPMPNIHIHVQTICVEVPLLQGLSVSSPQVCLSADEAYTLFTVYSERLNALGVELIVPKWVKNRSPLQVKIKTPMQLHERSVDPLLNWQTVAHFEYEIALGDQKMDQEQFQAYVNEKRPFIHVNGQWIAWDPILASRLQQYMTEIQQKFSYMDGWKWFHEEDPVQIWDDVHFGLEWSGEMKEKLMMLYRGQPDAVVLPPTVADSLRPYQKRGVEWLVHLRRIGFGGCLADDMGLGKSLQTIVYMQYVLKAQRKEGKEVAPFLLIVPTSLLYHWAEECQRFAPELRVFIHHGNERMALDDEQPLRVDVVLTSYMLAWRDQSLFTSVCWNGLILDEAQHMKNKDTKQRRAIRRIEATHRLALTGTPIENRLQELWSLMDLLNPSLLGSYASFQKKYIRPIERDGSTVQQETLKTFIRPFLLRRTKADQEVDIHLPEKREVTEYVTLSQEQAALYQAVVDDIRTRIKVVSRGERRAVVLRAMTRLKQICNHPAQFYKRSQTEAHESRKWDAVLEKVAAIAAKKEKVLIFTQYKEMGKLLCKALQQQLNQPVPFLHGGLSRKRRQEEVRQFQEEEDICAFVLSLKAGGTGLNLTAATNVIHYDRWWNPAVENQATDRVHRIGQTKNVSVYKFVTTGTLEERIDQLILRKQTLVEGMLAPLSVPLTEWSDEALLALIQLSNEAGGGS